MPLLPTDLCVNFPDASHVRPELPPARFLYSLPFTESRSLSRTLFVTRLPHGRVLLPTRLGLRHLAAVPLTNHFPVSAATVATVVAHPAIASRSASRCA